MTLLPAESLDSARESRQREQARVRPLLLATVCFLLGLAVGAAWVYRALGRPAAAENPEAAGQPAGALSAGTEAVLQRLDSPLEIRFYALLDPASVSESLRAFAGRVDALLSEYQRESGDRIKVTRYQALSDNAAAAAADGLQPFNLDKGEACYLGLTVAGKGQKETLPRLLPEWEPALEADVSRALERVANAQPPTKAVTAAPHADAATIAEVRRAIPNLASVSVEEGTRILREAALREFGAVAGETQAHVKQAQQRLSQAQNGGSAAEQQAAMSLLQRVQAEQVEKLQKIAARSQAQIAALQQLKAAAQ